MSDTPAASSRRRSRVLVLQALYETDTVHHDTSTTLEDGLENNNLLKSDREFAREVVLGVLANREELDNIINFIDNTWDDPNKKEDTYYKDIDDLLDGTGIELED